jgi:hypothetical protein
VVVHDLDVFRSSGRPSEADAPLVVDADAVRIGSVALELLEAVTWRNPEIPDLICGVQDEQLAQGGALGGLIETLRSLPLPHSFGVFVAERLQHPANNNAFRYERQPLWLTEPLPTDLSHPDRRRSGARISLMLAAEADPPEYGTSDRGQHAGTPLIIAGQNAPVRATDPAFCVSASPDNTRVSGPIWAVDQSACRDRPG